LLSRARFVFCDFFVFYIREGGMMSLLRLLGVAKKYENQPVLREVFFRLAAGDRVGLIGKNGVGKSID